MFTDCLMTPRTISSPPFSPNKKTKLPLGCQSCWHRQKRGLLPSFSESSVFLHSIIFSLSPNVAFNTAGDFSVNVSAAATAEVAIAGGAKRTPTTKWTLSVVASQPASSAPTTLVNCPYRISAHISWNKAYRQLHSYNKKNNCRCGLKFDL